MKKTKKLLCILFAILIICTSILMTSCKPEENTDKPESTDPVKIYITKYITQYVMTARQLADLNIPGIIWISGPKNAVFEDESGKLVVLIFDSDKNIFIERRDFDKPTPTKKSVDKLNKLETITIFDVVEQLGLPKEIDEHIEQSVTCPHQWIYQLDDGSEWAIDFVFPITYDPEDHNVACATSKVYSYQRPENTAP